MRPMPNQYLKNVTQIEMTHIKNGTWLRERTGTNKLFHNGQFYVYGRVIYAT